MDTKLVGLSKFLSLVLRHKPETIGLTLDANGWVQVDELIERANKNGKRLTRPLLDEIVATNDKKRFAFNEDGSRIRASQGHSVTVDLALEPQTPPTMLYHGTATRFVEAIRQTGLKPGSRQYVHLSLDEETALKVGQRHGKPIILRVKAGDMHRNGSVFYVSANGVWLTENVPSDYLEIPEL